MTDSSYSSSLTKMFNQLPVAVTKVLCALILFVINLNVVSTAQESEDNPAQATSRSMVLVPHAEWNCGMPNGIPNPDDGELIFRATMQLSASYHVGQTQFGDRWAHVVESGNFDGAKIKGAVLTGALDFQLELANDVFEIEQIMNLRSSDGSNIYVRTAGVGLDTNDIRLVVNFEAPTASDYGWLHEGTYLGRREVDLENKTMLLSVYRAESVKLELTTANSLQVEKPESVPRQTWDYRRADANETRGDQIISELVTLAPSVMVGPTKEGVRNTIPITGGTLEGKLSGKVLPGGADYQQLSRPAEIDARYLWQTDDGVVIIVRNAGSFGGLVPTFEAPVGSEYAWLNAGRFLSSNPEMGQGGVRLKFYECK